MVLHNTFSSTAKMSITQVLREPCNLGVQLSIRARELKKKNTIKVVQIRRDKDLLGAVEVALELLHAYLVQ